MKIIRTSLVKFLSLVLLVIALHSCDRDLSDDAAPAPFPNTAEIFTDDFVGMGVSFYFPFITAKPDVFSVDRSTGFESNASVRIDVPNADDPTGGFAGGIFRIDGNGRDLSGFDALTFYARASQAVTLAEIGYGVDFEGDRYATRRANDVDVTTNWTKFVVPIPDPSLLSEERGMIVFGASGIGPEGQEVGYTLWLDEIKFERLGTIGQSRPSVNRGVLTEVVSFTGGSVQLTNFAVTSNVDGKDITVSTSPAYFSFHSSDPSVATVDQNGRVNVIGAGEAQITASLDGVEATGGYTIKSEGPFITAPVPMRNPDEVISLFSDAYTNRPVSVISNFAGQNSTLSPFAVGGDNILFYQNVNFFAIQFNDNVALPLIDGSSVTTLHMDVLVLGDIAPGGFLNAALRDAGPNGMVETDIFTGQPIGDDSQIDGNAPLVSGQWVSLDLDITGLARRSSLAQIAIFTPEAGPNEFYIDNIYFY